MKQLFASGFCFLRERGDGLIELENKFTGLRLLVNERTGKYAVIGEEVL